MMTRIGANRAVLLWVTFGLIGSASVGFAADKGAQCATSKLTAASKYAACRLKADAKAAKTGSNADYSQVRHEVFEVLRSGRGEGRSGCLPN